MVRSLAIGEGREHYFKAVEECRVHEDAVECPCIVMHEAVLRHESKKECDLKEVQKDEKKVLMNSLKNIEEGSPNVKK